MRRFTFFLIAVATTAGLAALLGATSGHADEQSAPYVTDIPQGYRDWQWVSSAHEAGKLNSLGAVLGNDVAIKAFRAGTLPFPDGTIIAALHYRNVPSEENNKVFGQAQSFVPGAPTNIQFMVKDSSKYAATGGWGFGHFANGKPGDAAFMKSCFPCHEKTKATRPCLYSLRPLKIAGFASDLLQDVLKKRTILAVWCIEQPAFRSRRYSRFEVISKC